MTEMLEYEQELDEFSGCSEWVWRLIRAVNETPRGEWVSFSFKEIAATGVSNLQFRYHCPKGGDIFTAPKSQINCRELDAQMVILVRYFGLSKGTILWGKECRFCKGRRDMYVDNIPTDIRG